MPNEILMLIYVNVRLVEALILSFWKFEHFLCNCRVVEDLISTFSRACLTVKFTSPDVDGWMVTLVHGFRMNRIGLRIRKCNRVVRVG